MRRAPIQPQGLNLSTAPAQYAITFQHVACAIPPALISGIPSPVVAISIKLSCFEEKTHSVFGGGTWTGPSVQIAASDAASVDYSSAVFYYTRISDASAMIILELIATATGSNGAQRSAGLGWTIMPYTDADADVRGSVAVTMFSGSPRVLFLLEIPVSEYRTRAMALRNSKVTLTRRTAAEAASLQAFLPDSTFYSPPDSLPGVVFHGSSPTHWLEQIAVVPPRQVFVDEIVVHSEIGFDAFDQHFIAFLSKVGTPCHFLHTFIHS